MTIQEIKELVNQRIKENYTGDISAHDVNTALIETLNHIGLSDAVLEDIKTVLTKNGGETNVKASKVSVNLTTEIFDFDMLDQALEQISGYLELNNHRLYELERKTSKIDQTQGNITLDDNVDIEGTLNVTDDITAYDLIMHTVDGRVSTKGALKALEDKTSAIRHQGEETQVQSDLRVKGALRIEDPGVGEDAEMKVGVNDEGDKIILKLGSNTFGDDKVILRGVHTPEEDSDGANKKYVDDTAGKYIKPTENGIAVGLDNSAVTMENIPQDGPALHAGAEGKGYLDFGFDNEWMAPGASTTTILHSEGPMEISGRKDIHICAPSGNVQVHTELEVDGNIRGKEDLLLDGDIDANNISANKVTANGVDLGAELNKKVDTTVFNQALETLDAKKVNNTTFQQTIDNMVAGIGARFQEQDTKLTELELEIGIVLKDNFEIGNIVISNTGWTYTPANTRVRTKQNKTIHLKVGDTISLKDYSNARFYLGWRKTDNTYAYQGWLTSEFVATEEGDYAILLSNTQDTTITDINDLLDLLVVNTGKLGELSEELKDIDENLQDRISQIWDVKADNTTYSEKYGGTNRTCAFFPINNVDGLFYVKITDVIVPSTSTALILCLTTSESPYTSARVGIIANPINTGDDVEMYFRIPEQYKSSAKYIALYQNGANDGLCTFNVTLNAGTITSFSKEVEDIWEKIGEVEVTSDKIYIDGMQIPTVSDTGWYSFTDGSFHGSGNFLSYYFKNVSFSFIKVRVASTDSNPASIAFYSTDTPSVNGYIGGVQMKSGINDYTSEIPNGCKCIAVTNRVVLLANPMIKILPNDLYLYMGSLNKVETVTYNFATHRIKGINHRGFNSVAPENTMSAYKLSVNKGFYFLETDIRFTSDNVPVLLHDATIDRTSNGTGAISSMTFAQARQYDFGSWKSFTYAGEKIPSLEEFIVFCRNVGVFPYCEMYDFYSDTQIDTILSIIQKYGMERSVTFISFSDVILKKISLKMPQARIGYICEVVSTTEVSKIQLLRTGQNEVFADVHYTNWETSLVTCKANTIPMEIWTIDNATIQASLDDYVSGVTSNETNYEDVLRNSSLS